MEKDFDIIVNENGEKVLVKCNLEEGTVVIPDDVVHIGKKAFENKERIEEVILPQNLKTIGNQAFARCKNVRMVLPQGLTTIGIQAFFLCYRFNSPLPQGLTSIGDGAFYCCDLKEAVLPQGLEEVKFFSGCRNLSSVNIPDSVKIIGVCAFNNCSSLKSIIIPNSVIYIKDGAFSGCENLKSIFIPKSVQIIGDEAFKECKSLSIYCEGEPQNGWINRLVRDNYDEAELYAFNFHRSAGSFDYPTERKETWESYNPDNRPVFTNVSFERFLKLSESD